MAWVNISESTYKKTYDSGKYASVESNSKVYVTLQYDDTSVSTTSIKLRFKLNKGKDITGKLYDMFYVILDPTSSSRTLHPLKTVYTESLSESWPYVSTATFTITKDAFSRTFKIPGIWICNDGYNNTEPDTVNAFYNNYKDGTFRGINCRTVISSVNVTINGDNTIAYESTPGSITIQDNYNNTFTISATAGVAGQNNTVKITNMKWRYYNTITGQAESAFGTFTNNSTHNIVPFYDTNYRYIHAMVTYEDSYGKQVAAQKTAQIKCYNGPNAPSNINLEYGDRLTNKYTCGLTWDKPTLNSNCPVRGYRIRFFRKRGTASFVKLPFKNTSGSNVGTITSSDAFYDIDNNHTGDFSIPISIPLYGDDLLPDDIIKFTITPYTKYGNSYDGSASKDGNTKCFGTEATSVEYTIQNSGIVKTKVNNSWKDGQVYVKVNGDWKEANTVYTKVNGTWVESK